MQVTKDMFPGLRGDVYRVDGTPVAGRASDEHDDFWYINVNGLGIYAHVPTADGYGYEEIVIDESHDAAERWGRIVNYPQSLAETVKREVDAILIDRMLDAGELKLHFHGSDGDGYLSGHEAAVGSEADIRKEATGLAKEFVDVGSGDEDWSGWKIFASTEPDGKGITVAQFGFEELGVWSPMPEVEFDPTETYTGFGTDEYEAFRNALSDARDDGLDFDAIEGLSMDVSMDTDADGELYTRVDIEFRPNDSMTVMFWKPDDILRQVVDGEDIDLVVDAFEEDWITYSDDAVYALADQWKTEYENGEADMEDLIGIINRGDANNWRLASHLALGGDNEDIIREVYDRFVVFGGEHRETLMVTSKGDGIVLEQGRGFIAVEWDEVEKVITGRLGKTDDEDEVAELRGMLEAVKPSEILDVSDEGFLTLGKLIESGEFDGLDQTFANTEATLDRVKDHLAETEATLDRVNEQLTEFKWLNKAKALPGIIETTMTRDLGENMAPFAKSLGEIAGLACRQFPNDDEAVIRYLADGLVHKVGFDRNVAVAVLEGVVKVGDFDADPAAIMATIPTKDEIAAMERKAVETSGISR